MDNFPTYVEVKFSGRCARCSNYQEQQREPIPAGRCKISPLEVAAADKCHVPSDKFVRSLEPGSTCPVMTRNTLWHKERVQRPIVNPIVGYCCGKPIYYH